MTAILTSDWSRLTLLSLWPHYVRHIPRGTLQTSLLPLLLMGMRDTDPDIVAATLRSLADLVPVLGPEIVVGSNRTKIFSDGSPSKAAKSPGMTQEQLLQLRPWRKSSYSVEADESSSQKPVIEIESDPKCEENGEDWDDWSDDEDNINGDELNAEEKEIIAKAHVVSSIESVKPSDIASNVEQLLKNVQDLDIMKLDVKVPRQKSAKLEDGAEVDFFADMTPDIVRKTSSLDDFEAKLNCDKQKSVTRQVNTDLPQPTICQRTLHKKSHIFISRLIYLRSRALRRPIARTAGAKRRSGRGGDHWKWSN